MAAMIVADVTIAAPAVAEWPMSTGRARKADGGCAVLQIESRAFSIELLTVKIEICGLPPLHQKSMQGWATEFFTLKMKTPGALTDSICAFPGLKGETRGAHSVRAMLRDPVVSALAF